MALTIEVELPTGRYEAGGYDPGLPETVPSPFRLFCALVASAAARGDDAGFDALTWLEGQRLPLVHVPAVLDSGRDSAYVVPNAAQHETKSQSWPARGSGLRQRAWVTFATPRFAFSWPEAAPSASVAAILRELAAGVPYVGRVTSTARVRVAERGPATDGLTTCSPVTLRDPGVDVAVPYAGSVERLRSLHEQGDRAWEAARFRRYAAPTVTGTDTAEAHPSPFDRLVVFGLPPGASVDGRHLVKLTAALRAATMSRVANTLGEDRLPAALHGHDPTIRHVAFLGLPFVGHRRADGRLLGVAVALPRLGTTEEAGMLGGLVGAGPVAGGGLRELTGVFGCPVSVIHQPVPTHPYAISEARWRGGPAGSRCWVTATPIMLDRYARPRDDLAALVGDALVTAGYPAPAAVAVTPNALTPGGLAWQPRWLRQAGPNRPRRPVVHARVRFDTAVVGPVLAGSLRYLGVGLLAPEDDGS